MMPIARIIAGVAAALALASTPTRAQVLTVVEVNAPAINCVFNPSCTITVTDSVGYVPLPFLAAPKTAWLQSRTYTAAAGAPGAGKTGYEYRLSLTEASGTSECLTGLVINFGPHVKLPYKNGQLADIFVVTTGGLGTIGIKSAEKFGNVIEFTFSHGLCLAGAPDIKNTTFFFGMAANNAPATKPIEAMVNGIGSPPIYPVEARVPVH
jgi:hypothetical protein